jgi:hypothetical protein
MGLVVWWSGCGVRRVGLAVGENVPIAIMSGARSPGRQVSGRGGRQGGDIGVARMTRGLGCGHRRDPERTFELCFRVGCARVWASQRICAVRGRRRPRRQGGRVFRTRSFRFRFRFRFRARVGADLGEDVLRTGGADSGGCFAKLRPSHPGWEPTPIPPAPAPRPIPAGSTKSNNDSPASPQICCNAATTAVDSPR